MAKSSQTSGAGRSNATLWLLLGVLGVLAIGYFYTVPQIETWKSARAMATAKQRDVQSIQQRIAEIQQLDGQLSQEASGLDRLDLAVPKTPGSEDLLITLEAIAAASGTSLASVQPLDSTEEVAEPVITVGVTGSYGGVQLFLDLLSQNLRPIEVANLSLVGTSETDGASLVTATLTIMPAQALVVTTEQVLEEGGGQ